MFTTVKHKKMHTPDNVIWNMHSLTIQVIKPKQLKKIRLSIQESIWKIILNRSL